MRIGRCRTGNGEVALRTISNRAKAALRACWEIWK